MFNCIREECGVFGIYSNTPTTVANSVFYGLYALQHRGQESCGIVVNDRGVFSYHKGLGLVNEVFDAESLGKLPQGKIALGHVRYSTTGNITASNTQPIVVRHVKGPMAIAHNGNLINALTLRREYELKGAIFHSTSDTEVISYAITEARLETGSIEKALEKAMGKIRGAYSLVIMSAKKLIAARDPDGFRPLCIGTLPDGGYVVRRGLSQRRQARRDSRDKRKRAQFHRNELQEKRHHVRVRVCILCTAGQRDKRRFGTRSKAARR